MPGPRNYDMKSEIAGKMGFRHGVVPMVMTAEDPAYDGAEGMVRRFMTFWDLTVKLADDTSVYLRAPGLDQLLLMWAKATVPDSHHAQAATAPVPPAVVKRIGDAERQACIDALSAHFQAGRITMAEFDERSTQALASCTQPELGQLLADMPDTQAQGTPARVVTIYQKNKVNAMLMTLAIAFAILFLATVLGGSAGV